MGRRSIVLGGMAVAAALSACTCPAVDDKPAALEPPASASASAPIPEKSIEGNPLITWIKNYGPLGGGGGDHESAYTNLSRGECESPISFADSNSRDDPLDQPLRWLYGGAGSACLAALHGKPELWARAEHDYEQAKANPFGYSCGDLEVLRMLEALVQAHRAGITKFTKDKSRSVCPRLRAVKPDHGRAGGGYEVEVTGENLPSEPFYLNWCGTPIRVQASSASSLRVKVPSYARLESNDCRTVHIDVDEGQPVRPEATFSYDGV